MRTSISSRLPEAARQQQFVIAAFLLGIFALLASYPLVKLDTDLWYHLSGGRYLFEHGAIQTTSSFSFIEPPHEFVNYYWLFQSIVFFVHKAFGYVGIIFLRAAFYVATAWVIIQILVRRQDITAGKPSPMLLPLACMAALALLPRDLNPRPHLFSYFFLVSSLLVLERRKQLWLLPLIGVLWTNTHGVSYPVFLLPLLATLGEDLVAMLRSRFSRLPRERLSRPQRLWIIAALYTPLVSPFGLGMLETPLVVMRFVSYYIIEAMTKPYLGLTQFSFWPAENLIGTFRPLLLVLEIASLVSLTVTRRISLRHLLTGSGAVVLLSMHTRMATEAMLLLLPVLPAAADAALPRRAPSPRLAIVFHATILAFALLLPAVYLNPWPRWPLSLTGLPVGVTKFLQHVDTGGKVFNMQGTGGYLQWVLPPKYKIYMDLQMSLFDDYDAFLAFNAKSNTSVFNAFIQRYAPEYIVADGQDKESQDFLASSEDYRLVFFDDTEVLYASSKLLPDVTAAYALSSVSALNIKDFTSTTERAIAVKALVEFDRMLAIYPHSLMVNAATGMLRIATGGLDLAKRHAEIILHEHPQSYVPSAMLGDIATIEEDYEAALHWYFQSLNRIQGTLPPALINNIFTTYNRLGRNRDGHAFLLAHSNPFTPRASPENIANLGFSAASVGKAEEAGLFLRMARIKAPPSNTELIQKIDTLLMLLPGQGSSQHRSPHADPAPGTGKQ